MTPRDRLLAILSGRAADRPAVLCPGGMMSMAVTEVMAESGAGWPEAHRNAEAMVKLALAMQDETGFDNLAMPFCMTVEAEACGAQVDLGDDRTQPRVRGQVLASDGSGALPRPDFGGGRAAALLDAIRKAKRLRPDLAIIGNLVGPFSLLGLLADPLRLLRWTRRQPDTVRRYMAAIAEDLAKFGGMQAEAGADVICLAEPTATGEILGGALFGAFIVPYLAEIAERLRPAGPRIIVHICGDARPIENELLGLPVDAVSFDSVVSLPALLKKRPRWQVMGNVSPFLLESGPASAVRQRALALVRAGVRLLAPACGVIPTTPLAHLRAMREAVKAAPDS